MHGSGRLDLAPTSVSAGATPARAQMEASSSRPGEDAAPPTVPSAGLASVEIPPATVPSAGLASAAENAQANTRTSRRAVAPAPAEESFDTTPPTLAGFVIEQPIGRGGFAVVWSATREEDGAAIAIKVGHSDSALTHERFRRDAEALVAVGTPHAPHLYRSGRLEDGRPFLAMERLPGMTLAEHLAELARLGELPPVSAVEAVAGAVLDALVTAHEHSVLHRDLKPENIFYDAATGRASLIDFGLAKSTLPGAADITRPGTVIGTAEYMAPEQLRGDTSIDERTDLYSFGVILYQLLTRSLPFSGDLASIEHGHLALRPRRPDEIAEMPEELSALVIACLSKERERRPPSAAALRRLLASACAGANAGPRRLLLPDAPPSVDRRSPALASAKLLGEARRPMVVLVAETTRGAVHVSTAVTRRCGFIARQRASRYVCVFSGTDADDPVQAAIAAAKELVLRGDARTAIHLASLTLRRQEGGPPAVYGKAVERPETWLPDDTWTGLVLTADLARAVPEDDLGPVPEGAAFVAIPVSNSSEVLSTPSLSSGSLSSIERPVSIGPLGARQTPLIGQNALVEAIAASIRASFEGGCPGLFTVLGDPGLGKSRLASEAANLAARARDGVTVLVLRASPPLAGETAPLTRDLLSWLLETPGAAAPQDPRQLCIDKLGKAIGSETWPAIAALLGWQATDAVSAETVSIHSSAVRAIAEGLRRRAAAGPLALVLDDAHWADDAALDALEYATLDTSGCPLWVMVAAPPRLENVRRMWGARAERHDRFVLAPLDEASAMKLAAELLLPAEYPPAAVLKRLADWAGRNPACLADLARTLKRAGIVRRRRTSGSYYIATAELARLPPSTAWQWLAVRQLDALPPELSACVRLCSVLGVRFSREEVERVQDAIDRAGEAGTPVDMGVGLRALVDWKILSRGAGEHYSFQSATFQDAVEKLLDAAHRQKIHRHAFEVWRAWIEAKFEPIPEEVSPGLRTERTTWTEGWGADAGERIERDTWTGGFESTKAARLKAAPLVVASEVRIESKAAAIVEPSPWTGDFRQTAAGRVAPVWTAGGRRRSTGRRAAERGRQRDAVERLALHAGACGERTEAAAAYLLLGDEAQARHRHIEADHHYSAALSFLDEGDTQRRAIAHLQRGKARYRVYRVADAQDDLRVARGIAGTLSDNDALMADILLEEATALDHANDFNASASRVDEARPYIEQLGDEARRLRFVVALGRSRWRTENVSEAIDLLARGADGAKANGDHDTRVIALLLLSCALAVAGRVDEAVIRYIEVIELCMKVGDRLHLGMAYLNRVFLWLARKSLDEGVKDLRRAIQLAREVGNPWLERAATVNIAEILHWSAEDVEALAHARRSRVLAERFVDRPIYEDSLLLARIYLMRGQHRDARQELEWVAAKCPPDASAPTARALFRAVELVLIELGELPAGGCEAGIMPPERAPSGIDATAHGANDTDATAPSVNRSSSKSAESRWEEVLAQAQSSLLVEELLEILYWRARMALRAGRWKEAESALNQARDPLETCPGWRRRYRDLEAEFPSARASHER